MDERSLSKGERLHHKKVIDRMFAGGSRSLAVYPIRAVYRILDDDERQDAPVAMLVSVSKRKLRHATDRNRVKRLIREAYRHHKAPLPAILEAKGKRMAIAFIYLTNELPTSDLINDCIKKALKRIEENTLRLP